MKIQFKDFLKGESIFSHKEESELMEAKKKIKNFFLKNILELLTKREKEIYLMKNREYLTHSEIATKLGISRKTSRNILYTATKKIKIYTKKFQEEK